MSRHAEVSLKVLIVLLLLLAQASAEGVAAHHSTPVNFDQSKEITIEGVLTEIAWRNPHSRFRVDVTGEDGSTAEWLAEMGGINIMRRAGFPMKMFAVGDRITITGNPGRRSRSMRLRTVLLPDGTRLNEDSETSDYADDHERRNSIGGIDGDLRAFYRCLNALDPVANDVGPTMERVDGQFLS